MSASRWIMVPENLLDFLPVLREVWSLRIISKSAWPSKLFTPEMKIRLRSLILGIATAIYVVFLVISLGLPSYAADS